MGRSATYRPCGLNLGQESIAFREPVTGLANQTFWLFEEGLKGAVKAVSKS